MVFSTTNLFKGIQCPQGEQCALTNCIFSHDLRPQKTEAGVSEPVPSLRTQQVDDSDTIQEPPAKRQRVTYDKAADKPPSRADLIRKELAAVRERPPPDIKARPSATDTSSHVPDQQSTRPLPSLDKSVSPPPTNGKATSSGANNTRTVNRSSTVNNGNVTSTTASTHEAGPKETLNPRMVANDPAGHAKRTVYLKHIHAEMARLNQEAAARPVLQYKELLCLNEQELIKLALDDEEKVAREQPMLYANVIKNRIAFYKKMQLEGWVKHVKTTFEINKPKASVNKDAKVIDTGLSLDEEALLLPHLVTDQSRLAQFGYIPTPPTQAQALEAAAAVEASKNYEICDRCSARFQVFPERNEEGKLTSNGLCKHHPNKKVFPNKTKGDIVSGLPKEPYYPCCSGLVGSPGCTSNENHVFKSSNPARLAAVLPFITTPENDGPAKDKHGEKVKGVTFDCEMGYTVYGLELIRVTAVSWPSGEELLDVLVRPVGAIIDLNSRFSGVWPEHFVSATPYGQKSQSSDVSASALPIVESIEKARALLCTFLTPQTPLIGHAIDNDLNSIRLCHPTIIDTVILYPHPRGLPMRFGLKMLTSRHLGRNIQTGGDRGHDSLEDAQATGDLVRLKVGEKWKVMRVTGWQIVNGQLVEPPPLKGSFSGEGQTDLAKALVDKSINGHGKGKKRSRSRYGRRSGFGTDGAADESTEDEEVGLG